MKVSLNNILHNIKLPIMSFGIIAFTKVNDDIKYILINKKNTVGFCDIVKGNYDKYNIELSLKHVIPILTKKEVEIIKSNTFEDIWKYMWDRPLENNSKEVFELHREKIIKMLNVNKKYWNDTEWEFPKGRKNYQEKEIDCAIREFTEETGIDITNINIIYNILPLEEMYIGTNLNYYKHKYFLAYIKNRDICLDKYQKQEVKNIKLLSFEDCLKNIRNYHGSRKECMNEANNVINNLNFFSPDINVKEK